MTEGLLLRGIDGANPLAFLAALGTLRTLAQSGPDLSASLAWKREAGAWRPVIYGVGLDDQASVLDAIDSGLEEVKNSWKLPVDKNLKLEPQEYRMWASKALGSNVETELVAALATDAAIQTKGANAGKVATSQLQMVNGGKRQDFLSIINSVLSACTRVHIENTLFEEWRYADSMQALNLRWDPADDRQYALRWQNPSDSQTRKTGSQLGANRLAIEAIPLFTTCGTGSRGRTTGFLTTTEKGTAVWFRWPLWVKPAPLCVVRSLLSRAELQKPELDADDRSTLSELGISAVFGARRYAVDKYQTASFAAASPI